MWIETAVLSRFLPSKLQSFDSYYCSTTAAGMGAASGDVSKNFFFFESKCGPKKDLTRFINRVLMKTSLKIQLKMKKSSLTVELRGTVQEKNKYEKYIQTEAEKAEDQSNAL